WTPYMGTAAWTRQEISGHGSLGSRPSSGPVSATIAVRWPPAEPPITPTWSGSIRYFDAFFRSQRTAVVQVARPGLAQRLRERRLLGREEVVHARAHVAVLRERRADVLLAGGALVAAAPAAAVDDQHRGEPLGRRLAGR